MAHRSIWLRDWDGTLISRLIPFKGEKRFRESLKPFLIENKDKQKVLPSNKKEAPKKPQTLSIWSQL